MFTISDLLPQPWVLNRFVLCFLLFMGGGPAWAETSPLPQSFDLRDVDGRSFIGPVKDQSPMGTCYSFAAAAAAESTYNRAMNFHDENAVRFSESFIIWSLSQHYKGFGPYSGANYDYDELQALVDHGLPHEKDFPYVIEEPNDLHWDAERTQFSSWHRLPTNDIETTKRVLQTFGAIDAAVLVEDSFMDYIEGLFSDSYTSPLASVEFETDTNHAISLVGWNDNADGQGHGAWILRNSWGPEWGLDGYMLIDYTSAAVATSATYLVYGDWPGENFVLSNTADITATLEYSGAQPVARGIYEWGGTTAAINNSAQILAEANVESSWPYVHGIFLWAGAESSVTNTADIMAMASTANGQATAYGICMQGRDVVNSGSISAVADSSSGDRSTAYGVRQFGFDLDAAFDNTGSILAEAPTENGWAYGYFGNRIGRINNSGQIQANATDQAIGLLAEKTIQATNTGKIKANANAGSASGAWVQASAMSNDGEIAAVGSEGSLGILVAAGSFTNTGTISAFSESGEAIGAELWSSTLRNTGEIFANTTTGSATGIIAEDASSVINNGRIIGDSIISTNSWASGDGIFSGNVINTSGVVAPGNSIGTMTINGDYLQKADGSLNVDFARGQHDVLDVSGTATLDGALHLVLLDYEAGGAYSFLQAGGIDGTFATVDVPAVLNAALSNSPSGLDLNLTRNTYASLAANSGQGSVGGALDQFRADATGDMGEILTLVDNMNLDDVRSALSDMAPGIQAAMRRALVDLPHREVEAILERLEGHVFRDPEIRHDSVFTTDKEELGYAVWGSVSATVGNHDSSDVAPSLTTQTTDLFLGVEKSHGHWTTGVTAALLEHSLDSDDDVSAAEITAVRGYLHTIWRQRIRETGPYMAASLGAGRSRISTVRNVTFLGAEADAQHWGHDVSLGVGVGHVYTPGAWHIQPHLRLTGLLLHENAVEEHGATPMNLDIASSDSTSLHSALGLRLGRTVVLTGASLFPEAHVQWRHAVSDDTEHVQASFDGFGPDFEIDSDATRDELLLGVGVNLNAKNLHGGLLYEYRVLDGGDGNNHQLGLQLSYQF